MDLSLAGLSRIICTLVFFGAVFWLFVKYLRPALVAAQKARNELISGAERRRDHARARVEEAQLDLAGAERDAIAIFGRAEEQARHERTRILADAEDTGKRLVRNAEGELDRARYSARRSLHTEFVDKALDKARADASRAVDESVNSRLVDAFATALEHGARN